MANALGTPGPPGGPGVVADEHHRLANAGLIAHSGTATLAARTGVMAAPGSLTLITGTSATGTMTVNVGPHHAVTSRGTADGVYLGPTKEASTTVNIAAAPGANSRIDVVYSRQRDQYSTLSPDGSSAEEYGVVTGTAAASPTKPNLNSVPGAVEIGTVQVAAGATSTSGAGVTITNTALQVVANGGVTPVRNKAERDAITGHAGYPLWRNDVKTLEVLSGSGAGVLAAVFGAAKIIRTAGTAAGALTNANVGLHPAVTINQPYGVGVPFQGFIVAVSFVSIQAASEAWLAVNGDPTTFPNSREYNTGGTAENRTVIAFNSFDTGSADTFTFQPIHKAVGTITPFADGTVAYSIALALPKGL